MTSGGGENELLLAIPIFGGLATAISGEVLFGIQLNSLYEVKMLKIRARTATIRIAAKQKFFRICHRFDLDLEFK